MLRRLVRLTGWAVLAGLIAVLVAGALQYRRARHIREALYAAFTPVRITNCTLKRFGNANDGGYLMCANLIGNVQAGYSYGINGEDAWSCDVLAQKAIPIHQYDCFNTNRPACGTGETRFHAECIGPEKNDDPALPVDTFANQVEKNGDTGKRLIVKMDAEGAEWRSLAGAPEHVLNAIDQMVVKFHEVEQPHFLDTAARLNEFFYVAHVHHNNFFCADGYDPFPGQVFEVLFVNKRIAVADPWVDARGPSPLDAPSTPQVPDCQASPGGNELQRIARWTRRRTSAAMQTVRDHLQR